MPEKQTRAEAEVKPEADMQGVEEAEQAVQDAVDDETTRGLRGVEVDSTPNENYTVAGVLAGKSVPEATADPAAARREASAV